MISFAWHVIDRHVGTQVSRFRTADIEDCSALASDWMGKHFLNSVLRGRYREIQKQLAFNFLRRVQAGFSAHRDLRDSVAAFLGGSRQSLAFYVTALNKAEEYMAQCWMAWDSLAKMLRVELFKRRDGSLLQRLNGLHGRVKHAADMVSREFIEDDGPTVIWLANDGICSKHYRISWAETAMLLKDLARWADALEDPLTVRSRVLALLDQSPAT